MRGSAAFRVAVAPGGALAGPWVRDPLWTAARAVPSLDLRFADNKSLVDATTGQNLVTFTRASSGTFVGSDGVLKTATTNEPRFDHNPTTGESLGLLVEEARTNLNLYSEDFSNAIYSLTAATVSTNTSVAPDGTTTADTVNSSGTAVVSQSFTKAASAITYTGSLFVKGSVTDFSLTIDDGTTVNRGRARFNLSTGTLGSVTNDGTFTGTTATITLFPNGWYRLTVTTTTNILITARLRSFWTGAGTSIDFWGAQLETGAFATSYIPTVAATATRAVDVVSITGSNFSSWYNQTEGTFAWSGSTYNTQYANQNAFRVTEGTNLRGIGFGLDARTGTDDAYFSTRNNTNITSVNSSSPYVTVTSNIRIGGAFGTDIAASFNGSTPLVASPAYVFGTENQMEIMGSKQISGTANQYNGHTRRLTFWPIRFGGEVLQRITQ